MPPQSVLTMPILPGIDGVQQDVASRSATTSASPSPPEEIFGKLMRIPDEAMPVYYDLLLDEPLDPALPAARRQARARARDRPSASTATDAAARGRGALRPRSTCDRELPDEIEEHAFARRRTARCTCRRCCRDAFGMSRSEARRLLAQGGVQARRRAARRRRDLDVPAERLDGAVLQVGKRRRSGACVALSDRPRAPEPR